VQNCPNLFLPFVKSPSMTSMNAIGMTKWCGTGWKRLRIQQALQAILSGAVGNIRCVIENRQIGADPWWMFTMLFDLAAAAGRHLVDWIVHDSGTQVHANGADLGSMYSRVPILTAPERAANDTLTQITNSSAHWTFQRHRGCLLFTISAGNSYCYDPAPTYGTKSGTTYSRGGLHKLGAATERVRMVAFRAPHPHDLSRQRKQLIGDSMR